MTVKLMPMQDARFSEVAPQLVVDYAQDNVRAGRWQADGAMQRSQLEFDRLLPKGIKTPGHHLFDIVNESTNDAVGCLWFAILGVEPTSRSGHIYYIQVAPEHRGRGFATGALRHIEQFALSHGIRSIALQVFSFNDHAEALYRSLSYRVTGLNMVKSLSV